MPPTDVNQALKFQSGGGAGIPVHMTKESKLLQKCKKKSVGWGRDGGQGGYEQRIEVIVKIAIEKVEGSPVQGWVGVRVDANI